MRTSLTVCAILFCLCLFGMALLLWLLPKQDFSPVEKRALARLQKPTVESLGSGAWGRGLDAFCGDHLPLRDRLVALKARAELCLGKQENDGILQGSGGYLARRRFSMRSPNGERTDTDLFFEAQVAAACEGILRAERALDVPFAVLLTGRNLDACPNRFSYPREVSDTLNAALRAGLADCAAAPDLVSLFRAAGDGLYYRTDHHWTTAGAYLGYTAAMDALGRGGETLPQDAFRRETVCKDFYGTLWAASGIRTVKPDRVELWYRGNEADFAVTADGRDLDGLYTLSRLEGIDPYSVFLDGTHDVVTVTSRVETDRPRLLVLRDSFGASLAPFLAQHYDLVLLNLSSTRRDMTDLSALARDYRADAVLLVYSIENLLTADRLPRLR